MSPSDANYSTLYPKAVSFVFKVVTNGFPDGANPTFVPVMHFFKNGIPGASGISG